MPLEHANIGFLNYHPYSGYDLKRIFDASVLHFWAADQSQTYRTLARMSENGWVEIRLISQETRPDRKLYHITPTGKDKLHRRLLESLSLKKNRSAEMIQVFFAGSLSDEEIPGIFERTADLMRTGMEHYARISRDFKAYGAYTRSPREFFFWMLTLDVGIHTLQSNLDFLENLIRRIRKALVILPFLPFPLTMNLLSRM